jgi:hypothetical protein
MNRDIYVKNRAIFVINKNIFIFDKDILVKSIKKQFYGNNSGSPNGNKRIKPQAYVGIWLSPQAKS